MGILGHLAPGKPPSAVLISFSNIESSNCICRRRRRPPLCMLQQHCCLLPSPKQQPRADLISHRRGKRARSYLWKGGKVSSSGCNLGAADNARRGQMHKRESSRVTRLQDFLKKREKGLCILGKCLGYSHNSFYSITCS